MRSKLFIIACIMALSATICAHAQFTPSLGVRLSMELSTPSGATSYFKTGSGFTAGIVSRFSLPAKLFVEPGILFVYSAMTDKNPIPLGDFMYQGSVKQYGIRVPINVGYRIFPNESFNIDVYTGPWINFNIASKQTLDPNFSAPTPVPTSSIDLMKYGWRRVDTQWGFGLGFTFAEKYHVGVSGGIGMTPLARFGNKDKKIRIHRNVVALTMGYNF